LEDRAADLLKLYGLSDREALVYLHILKNGSSSAGEVAKALQLRRMEAYRLVKRLVDQNLIGASPGKPVKYVSQPIEAVIATMMEGQVQKLKGMEVARQELLSISRNLPRAGAGPSEQRFKIIQGREQIYAQIGRMVDASSASLDLMFSRNDLVQSNIIGITDRLNEAASRGTKVRAISLIDETTLEAAEAVSPNCEVRHSADSSIGRLIVKDSSQTLTSLVMDESQGQKNERDIAIWSDSRDYAEMMSSLFEAAFKSALPQEERMKTVKTGRESIIRTKTITEVLRATMPEDGWTVDAPGNIAGSSGTSYDFDAILAKGDKRVGVDIVFGVDEALLKERIMAAIMKKLDLQGHDMILISQKDPGEEAARLSKLLGVTIVQQEDTIAATSYVRKMLKPST